MALPTYDGPLLAPESAPREDVDVVIDDYDVLEGMIEHAGEKDVLNDNPSSAADSLRSDRYETRNQTTRARLRLLGYLEQEPGIYMDLRLIPADEFREAVRRFQTEAGLVVDGWVGDTTWFALDALMGFESETGVAGWLQRPEAARAFRRAVAARLACLGFGKRSGEVPSAEDVAKSLKSFGRAVVALGLAPPDMPRGFKQPLLEILFDQDGLVEGLARVRADAAGEEFALAGDPSKTALRFARRLAVNAAKIELWLLDLMQNIDGLDNYVAAGLPRGNASQSANVRFGLREFWQRYMRLGSNTATRLARRVRPAFFAALVQEQQGGELEITESDASLRVAEEVQTPSRVEEMWDTVKRLGAKLWDGLKRLWRWIKRGVKAVLRSAANLARGFFRYALKAYRVVKKGLRMVVDGVRYALKSRLPHTAPGTLVAHDKDFDFLNVCLADAPPEAYAATQRSLRYHVGCLQIAGGILRLVVRALRATGLGGWAGLLLALVRSLRALKPLYAQLKAVARLQPA